MIYIFLFALIYICANIDVELGNKFIEINNHNFKYTKYDNTLYALYKPWSSEYRNLVTILNHLAKVLAPKVKVATIDMIAYKNITSEFQTEGSLTLVLHKADGKNAYYNGLYNFEKILEWLERFGVYSEIPDDVQLEYFKCRGRAESIRLTLNIKNISYTEKLHTSKKWPEAKKEGIESGKYTFGQLPYLEYGSMKLVQSQTILRFLARKLKLYGITHEEGGMIDMLMDDAFKVETQYNKWAYTIGCLDTFYQFRDSFMPYLDKWEKVLENKKVNHFVTDSLTMADITIYNMLDLHLRYFEDEMNTYTKLMSFVKEMDDLELIKSYKTSKRRIKAINGKSACIDSKETLTETDRL